MKKVITISVVIIVGLLIAVGIFFWYQMQQPLYEPGMVQEGQRWLYRSGCVGK